MLGADAGKHAVARMHQLHQLADVAHVTRAHFSDEHLMRVGQLLVDHLGKTHRRVDRGLGGVHIVFHGQDGLQAELRAGLAIAAGDANFDQVLPRGELLLRHAKEAAVEGLLQRLYAARGQPREPRRKNDHRERGNPHQNQTGGFAAEDEEQESQRRGDDQRQRDGQADHAAGELHFFLLAGFEILHDHQRRVDGEECRGKKAGGNRAPLDFAGAEQAQKHRQDDGGNARDQTGVQRPAELAVLFALQPAHVAVQLVAFQLQHMQVEPARGQRNQQGNGQLNDDQPPHSSCTSSVRQPSRNLCAIA